jgi:hypothetical protein
VEVVVDFFLVVAALGEALVANFFSFFSIL